MTFILPAWPALLSFWRRQNLSAPAPDAPGAGEHPPPALCDDLGLPPPCGAPHCAEALHFALLR